jgi:toxin ParE1/3/4
VIRVIITARAERDPEEIWLTIAPDNPRAATRLLRAIGRKIDLLADFPRLGTHRGDITPGMRMMVARPFLVL